jgi:putative Mn2+ efflux pump MntP
VEKNIMNSEANIKKEGIPCRVLAGLVSIPCLIIGVGMLFGGVDMLFSANSIGWGVFTLLGVPFDLFIGCEFASVALRGKSIFLYKTKKN